MGLFSKVKRITVDQRKVLRNRLFLFFGGPSGIYLLCRWLAGLIIPLEDTSNHSVLPRWVLVGWVWVGDLAPGTCMLTWVDPVTWYLPMSHGDGLGTSGGSTNCHVGGGGGGGIMCSPHTTSTKPKVPYGRGPGMYMVLDALLCYLNFIF